MYTLVGLRNTLHTSAAVAAVVGVALHATVGAYAVSEKFP